MQLDTFSPFKSLIGNQTKRDKRTKKNKRQTNKQFGSLVSTFYHFHISNWHLSWIFLSFGVSTVASGNQIVTLLGSSFRKLFVGRASCVYAYWGPHQDFTWQRFLNVGQRFLYDKIPSDFPAPQILLTNYVRSCLISSPWLGSGWKYVDPEWGRLLALSKELLVARNFETETKTCLRLTDIRQRQIQRHWVTCLLLTDIMLSAQ